MYKNASILSFLTNKRTDWWWLFLKAETCNWFMFCVSDKCCAWQIRICALWQSYKYFFLTVQDTEIFYSSTGAQNDWGNVNDDWTFWDGVGGATGSAFRRKPVRWVSQKRQTDKGDRIVWRWDLVRKYIQIGSNGDLDTVVSTCGGSNSLLCYSIFKEWARISDDTHFKFERFWNSHSCEILRDVDW